MGQTTIPTGTLDLGSRLNEGGQYYLTVVKTLAVFILTGHGVWTIVNVARTGDGRRMQDLYYTGGGAILLASIDFLVGKFLGN